MAAVTCFAGLHFGHVVVHFKSHTPRVLLWFISSLIFLLCGLAVQMLGMPSSKPLYTLSYMLLTTGVSGIVLTLIYCTDKIKEARNTQQVTQGNCSLQPILTEVLGDNKGKYIRGKGSHTKKKDVDTSAGRYEQEALNELIKQNQELRHTFRGEIEAREQRRDAQFKEEMQEVRGILSVLCRALNVPLPNQSSRPEDNVSASRRLGSNEDLTGTSQ